MTTRRQVTSAWLCSIVVSGLLATAACSSSTKKDSKSSNTPVTTTTPAATNSGSGTFVAQVNAMCEALIPKVIAINEGKEPALGRYLVDRPKLLAVFKTFDAQVAAIPVSAADKAAADAFATYQHESDAGDVQMAKAAASGKKDVFDAAAAAALQTYQAATAKVNAAGIECPAR